MSQVTTRAMAREQEQHEQEIKELNAKAAAGETVVPGGKGGHSLEAQQHLAAGRKAGGEARKQQIIHDAYAEMSKKADHTKHPDGTEVAK